ncbi:hypothetical protein BK142_27905 [Paenibacillus glucanolyticus]|jgi:hypothetical protein|nr:hypothetical protein A3958_22265 [Paenibacillus glucanolyticus]OMF68212.1 hypothetical protein BK142_27905 [Paenibacillus glucanolyticus]
MRLVKDNNEQVYEAAIFAAFFAKLKRRKKVRKNKGCCNFSVIFVIRLILDRDPCFAVSASSSCRYRNDSEGECNL